MEPDVIYGGTSSMGPDVIYEGTSSMGPDVVYEGKVIYAGPFLQNRSPSLARPPAHAMQRGA
jgi:hypothetical protein